MYQTTDGAKDVTREEMRAFKKVWAEFANQKTGLLERAQLGPFFYVSLPPPGSGVTIDSSRTLPLCLEIGWYL